MCSESHSTIFCNNTEHVFKFTTVIISYLFGSGRWRLLINVSVALSIYALFLSLSSYRVFGLLRKPISL